MADDRQQWEIQHEINALNCGALKCGNKAMGWVLLSVLCLMVWLGWHTLSDHGCKVCQDADIVASENKAAGWVLFSVLCLMAWLGWHTLFDHGCKVHQDADIVASEDAAAGDEPRK